MDDIYSMTLTMKVQRGEWKEIASVFDNGVIDWVTTVDGLGRLSGDTSFKGESTRKIQYSAEGTLFENEMEYLENLSASYPSLDFQYKCDSSTEWFCNGDSGSKEWAQDEKKKVDEREVNKFTSAKKKKAEGIRHQVEIMPNGCVAADGENRYGECNVFSWSDIVQVSCGNWHTVGQKKDGSVLACGSNVNGQCDVSDLEEKAVSISCGRYHTAILLESGKVLIKGDIQLNGATITQDIFGNKIDLDEVSKAIKKAFPLRGEMRVNCNHRNWQLQNERIEQVNDGDALKLKRKRSSHSYAVTNANGHLLGDLEYSGHDLFPDIGVDLFGDARADCLDAMKEEIKVVAEEVRSLSRYKRWKKYAGIIVRIEYVGPSEKAKKKEDGAKRKISDVPGKYPQTNSSSWPKMKAILSVYDAVIGVTEDDLIFVEGNCPCSEVAILKIAEDTMGKAKKESSAQLCFA